MHLEAILRSIWSTSDKNNLGRLGFCSTKFKFFILHVAEFFARLNKENCDQSWSRWKGKDKSHKAFTFVNWIGKAWEMHQWFFFFEGRSNVKIFFSMLLRAFQDSASRAHSKKKFVKFFDFSFLANFPLFPFTHS